MEPLDKDTNIDMLVILETLFPHQQFIDILHAWAQLAHLCTRDSPDLYARYISAGNQCADDIQHPLLAQFVVAETENKIK